MTQILPEQLVEGESNVLWGVPDDVLLLLKQYDFSEHVSPTYTVTGSPNGLHFICVWPTKESKLGDKVLQDIMKIHQITDIKTAEIATQTDSGCGTDDLVDNTEVTPIEYPEYQNHEELDIEIEKTEAERALTSSGCASSCSKSNSADSGHQPSDQETDKNEKKDLDDVTDIEEIEEPIHSIDNITKSEKHKIVRPGFDSYQSATQPIRNMHNIHHFNPQFPNMPYSGLALIQQQAALRNHQIQMQHNNTNTIIPKSEYSHASVNQVVNQMGEPNVRQHLNDIYRKYNIVPKRIQGGTLEEVLRPPMKSQGHRTAHQIHLMRRMREVSSKMNLTDCANPNYEDAVSVLLDSFEITAPYVNAPEYRRKMNFLLRKRINNRRWFLRKKAKGASMSESPMEISDSPKPTLDSAHVSSPPAPAQLREYFNPLMAAALARTAPAGPLIGGTPMIDTKVDLTVN
jgi:hypothetical protein